MVCGREDQSFNQAIGPMLEIDAVSSPQSQKLTHPVGRDDFQWPIHRGLLLLLAALTVLDLAWMALSDLDLAFWPAAGRFGMVGALLLSAGYYGLSGR